MASTRPLPSSPVMFPKILFGGDYNPDQWPEEAWKEDMRMFRLAGIDVATVPVFAWAKLQPAEDTYDFSWLDRVVGLLSENGIRLCLATSTAAVPAWMAMTHPDVLRTTISGARRKWGARHNFCPNSPTFRTLAPRLAGKLAERYGKNPALIAWHINNEYGGACYCERCEAAFRGWLRRRYGSLQALNDAWWTGFWGHTITDWDQVVAPSLLSEHQDAERTDFQGITLDYYRFNSDSILACYMLERDAIRPFSPGVPITTNLMGTYKGLDYHAWAREMDIVSWDSYPPPDMPPSDVAFRHDLMRGLKSGQPFMLMEQTPSQTNWQPYNRLKRPGVMRLQSWQAVARGADAIMFFQLRRSRGACEKYHGAVIDHVGHENTRVFREVSELGAELGRLGGALIGSRVEARVALLFDWDNWWALEMSMGPSVAVRYLPQCLAWQEAFWAHNISVDVVGVEEDLSPYGVVIAPALYMLKRGVAARITDFVRRGGTFLTTFFSGIVNETDIVTPGGYPGELRSLLGIWVEEIDPLLPDQKNSIVLTRQLGGAEGAYECGIACDLLHSEGAEVLGVYGSDFYRGMPCSTRNTVGLGQAWYVASSPERKLVHLLASALAADKGIQPVLRAVPGVEATRRHKGAESFLFVLNHHGNEVTIDLGHREGTDLLQGRTVSGVVPLPAHGVMVVREQAGQFSGSFSGGTRSSL